ncbi:hypothetical protein CEXT_464161, partial [Caerostris extrusa]
VDLGDLPVLILQCVSERDAAHLWGWKRIFWSWCLTEACVWPLRTWRSLSRRLGDPCFYTVYTCGGFNESNDMAIFIKWGLHI